MSLKITKAFILKNFFSLDKEDRNECYDISEMATLANVGITNNKGYIVPYKTDNFFKIFFCKYFFNISLFIKPYNYICRDGLQWIIFTIKKISFCKLSDKKHSKFNANLD